MGWSCESEQVGYEVTIPLFGPTEFQETSCEISGDICSTDDDCVDEDGLFVGPCTKTLEVLEPIAFDVTLTPSTPSYRLPVPNTASWIAPLNVRTYSDELPISIQMDNFSLENGPVDISVRVFSRIGRITGRNLDYMPVTPDSCTFRVSEGPTAGEDFANGIQTCLSDWIGENGAPLEFDMEVTSSAGPAPASAALEPGFGPKQQQPTYRLSGFETLSTVDECEVQGPEDALEAGREGSDFFELLECEGLTFTGSGFTDDPLSSMSGGAVIYDRCGNALAQGNLLDKALDPGPYQIVLSETDGGISEDTGVLEVEFEPNAEAFLEALGLAAAGDCVAGTQVEEEGYAVAWWNHCGPTSPRTGYIEWGATGFCPVAEDSGTGGTSGQ